MAQSSYFYVLYCKDNTLYGGYTTDLKRREKEHNDGIGAKYTRLKSRRPAKMIYAEAFETRSEATKAEYTFKHQSRSDKERYLNEMGVTKPYTKIKQTILVDKREVATDEKPEE